MQLIAGTPAALFDYICERGKCTSCFPNGWLTHLRGCRR